MVFGNLLINITGCGVCNYCCVLARVHRKMQYWVSFSVMQSCDHVFVIN